MNSSLRPEMKTLRNSRLKAERDRQFAESSKRLKKIGIIALIGAGVLGIVVWQSGCTLADGCSTADAAVPVTEG